MPALRKTLAKTLLFTLVVILFSCSARSESLSRKDIPGLMNRFLYTHVAYNSFSDAIAERTVENLILNLDNGKNHFYKEDVEKIRLYSDELYDFIQDGNYDFLDETFNLYKNRVSESIKIAMKYIESDHDFSKDEKVMMDSDSLDWASDTGELEERWRKNIKMQLLNYKSAGQTIDEAREKLEKRYKRMARRTEQYDEERKVSVFINSFSMALDPHSNYLTHEENEDFKISMELKLEGIGVRLRTEDGYAIVDSIIPGGPADKLPEEHQLMPNDRIVAVTQNGEAPENVIDLELREVVNKIRGEKGTRVKLTILRSADKKNSSSQRLIIPIIREEIQLEDSAAKAEAYQHETTRGSFNIGYLRLPSFYMDQSSGKSSAGDVKKYLMELNEKNVEAVILDLRGNPGGLLNESVDIAGLFLDRAPIVQIKDGRNQARILYNNDPNVYYEGPLVILIDKFSASASEIMAGAMQDYNRAIVIGPSNTYGKGTVQSYNVLPRKMGAMKVTTHIFYQPGGRSNQLNGIKPDIIVPDLSSAWDIGENKTRFPLEWEPIDPAPYPEIENLVNDNIISFLSSSSEKRIKADPEYTELLERIKRLEEQMQNKQVSLKEEDSENENVNAKEDELERLQQQQQHLNRDEKLIDPEKDLFLMETFNITADYINKLK